MSDRATFPYDDDEPAEREGHRVDNLRYNRENPDEVTYERRRGACARKGCGHPYDEHEMGVFCP